jgi:TetR/AcrR family transcriptional regulator, cholesterol catabolism regulator
LRFIMTDIDTKERIKLAANELVMKYGVRSVSMDDIAAHLGISKKTIYLYYKDKDDLVEAIIEAEIGRTQDICERDLYISENAIHEVVLAMDMMVEIFHSMNPSLLFDLRKYHPRAFEKFNLHKTTYLFEVMKKNLVRGVKEKLYRPEINIEVMARFRVESVFIPMMPEFHAGIKSSLLEAEEQLIIHFLFGLVTPKGYELMVNYLKERNMPVGKTDKKSKVNG